MHNPWRPDLTPPVSLKTVNSSDEILDTAFDIVFRPLFAYKRRQAQKTKNPDYYWKDRKNTIGIDMTTYEVIEIELSKKDSS